MRDCAPYLIHHLGIVGIGDSWFWFGLYLFFERPGIHTS